MNFSKSGIIFIFLTLLVLFVTHIYVTVTMPIVNNSSEKKIIAIPKGMNIEQVAVLLKKEGVIKDIYLFKILTRMRRGMIIKAGEYQLDSRVNMLQLLNILQHGRMFCHRVTIPEGYTIWQIAGLLAREGLADKERFINLACDSGLAKSFGILGDTVEGYLFPDTYYFSRGVSEESIIATMIERSQDMFLSDWCERSREMGFTPHQIITLASLIEKETSSKEEKTIVSAVYHNRLSDGIKLQCDPTVVYGLSDFDGHITKEHLLIDSPYNTYRYAGLPPGPIANPGQDSILAALYPAEVIYRYFVSRNDGTHYFSYTLKEHNQAVYKYQKR